MNKMDNQLLTLNKNSMKNTKLLNAGGKKTDKMSKGKFT